MKKFCVEVITATPNPQQAIWAAMHQDYTEQFVFDSKDKWPDEQKAGELVVKHLLLGDRGHFGPLEHPQITFNVGYFPHSTMQQLRTHRVGISFDVQSFRYTSQGMIEAATGLRDIEEIFYLRPVGEYRDRQGKRYTYSQQQREEDLRWCQMACNYYKRKLDDGHSEEHARGILPFDLRQHWVMSVNTRSLMHLLDIRGKADSQLEIQQLTEILLQRFKEWMPEVANWYESTRWRKGKLAP